MNAIRAEALGFAVVVLAALTLVAPNQALASPIVEGESVAILIDEMAGGAGNEENVVLTGSITFAVVSTSQFVLDIDLTNASSHGARMVSLGFDLATVRSLDSVVMGGGFDSWNVALAPQQPMNGIRVDLCIYAGRNCAGGGSAGLTPGSLSGSVTLNGEFSDPLHFLGLFARFQDVGRDSEGSETFPSRVPVPAPGALGLLGLGLLGLVLMRRRPQFRG